MAPDQLQQLSRLPPHGQQQLKCARYLAGSKLQQQATLPWLQLPTPAA